MDMFPEGIFLTITSDPEQSDLDVQGGQLTIPLKVDWTAAALQSSIEQGRSPNCTFGTKESRWCAIIVTYVALELKKCFQHGFSSIEEAERARQKFIFACGPYGAVMFSEGHQHITWSLQCFSTPLSCQRWPLSKEITGDNFSPVACVGKAHKAAKDGEAQGEDWSADKTPSSDNAKVEPLGMHAWLECDGSPLLRQESKCHRSRDRRDDRDGDKLRGTGGACRKKPRQTKGPNVDGALGDAAVLPGQHCTKKLATMKRPAIAKARS